VLAQVLVAQAAVQEQAQALVLVLAEELELEWELELELGSALVMVADCMRTQHLHHRWSSPQCPNLWPMVLCH
jgi:hypothetical protein